MIFQCDCMKIDLDTRFELNCMKRYLDCTKFDAGEKSDADESDADGFDADGSDCISAETCRNSEFELDRMRSDFSMKFELDCMRSDSAMKSELDCMHFETCRKADFNCHNRKHHYFILFDFRSNLNRKHRSNLNRRHHYFILDYRTKLNRNHQTVDSKLNRKRRIQT